MQRLFKKFDKDPAFFAYKLKAMSRDPSAVEAISDLLRGIEDC